MTRNIRRLLLSAIVSATVTVLAVAAPLENAPLENAPREKASQLGGLVDLLPQSTVVVAEIVEPNELIDSLLSHPVRERIESLPEIKQAQRKAEYIQFRLIVSWVELQLGMSWDETLRQVTAKGLVAGVDAETEGLAIIAQAADKDVVARVVKTMVGVARRDAKRRDVEIPYETHEYRGLTAYQFDDLLIAQIGDLLLLSNKPELAKAIADRALDEDAENQLTSKLNYKRCRGLGLTDHDVHVYVDLDFVRDAGAAKELFRERAENIAAEFLFGMLMEAIQDAPALAFGLSLDAEQAVIELGLPHDPATAADARQYAFGPDGNSVAPYELKPERSILSIASYRDLGELWLAKEDLLEEDQIAELAQADSNLTTVFSGLDFGEEVLGSTQPGIQFVAASQTFGGDRDLPVPDIRLPGFAVVFRLDDPAKIRRRFKIGFQSFVGFINIEQGQNGQPQFDVETTRKDGMQLTTANYFVDDRFEEGDTGLINYNFSPTIAFLDDWFVISSTRQLAVDLMKNARSEASTGKDANTTASLEMPQLIETLSTNSEHLIAQNMLEKGNSRKQAKREIDIFLELLSAIEEVDFEQGQQDEKMSFKLTVETLAPTDDKGEK